MTRNSWLRAAALALAGMTAAACSTYPDAPRYPTRPVPPGTALPGPAGGPPPATPYVYNPAAPAQPATPAAPTPVPGAAVAPVEGGALPPALTTSTVTALGLTYEVQPGDTVSGVARRFRTPVQTLIDLNTLGPRGAVSAGQRLRLPDGAVDGGVDPYATGPSPVGVEVTNAGAPPPPPPPVAPARPVAPATPPGTGERDFTWPLRGDIVRRFGPVGVSERPNGINIAAPRDTPVVAAAAGRVAYVGDDLVGQGLTVLITHLHGWRTVYGHLGSASVRDGDNVTAGQTIGTVGETAGDGRPSMHFETRRMRGDDPAPIDPLTVLPR
ncbi:MAG: peptidoglycan DD-metalloendopeptidase family protein [Brevundimonas sp.]|uniref:peptidoglycan DD-metalloendopeptidase family protein n=1 Tax=Brevundimonas sp. TaxID=1871086 RepID=UPI00391EE8A0